MRSTAKEGSGGSGAGSPAGFHSVLVAVDLTPAMDRILSRASLLPLADDARVTLLHVIPGSLVGVEQRKAARDAEKTLADEVRHLRGRLRKDIRIASLVTVGAAAKEIARAAAAAKAELIVMGRGGGRALRDAFLGSTAERVVRQAQKPVLVARLPARAPYRRPALALDLDEAAAEVVRLMVRVLPAPRPQVEVIHAFQIPYQGMIYPSLSEDEADERKDELRAAAGRELAELLLKTLSKANVPPRDRPFLRTHVQFGPPRLVVEKAIKKAGTDLLLLGTHGHSGLAHLFLGTVAGELLRAAACDVLVVPPRRAHK